MNRFTHISAMIRPSRSPSSSSSSPAPVRELPFSLPPLEIAAQPLLASQIVHYSPTAGKPGESLSIQLSLSESLTPDLQIFVFMDSDIALDTKVERYSPTLDILATIPSPRNSDEQKALPLRVDFVHKDTQRAVHSLPVGTFSYAAPRSGASSVQSKTSAQRLPQTVVKEEDVDAKLPPRKRRSKDEDDDDDDWVPPSKRKARRSSRSLRKRSSKGSSAPAPKPAIQKPRPPPTTVEDNGPRHGQLGTYYSEAKLRFVTDWRSLAYEWDCDEVVAGRRLVRFQRAIVNGVLQITTSVVRQDDWSLEEDKKIGAKTISCIYNPSSDTCCLTSTEAIFLMEHLADVPDVEISVPFSVDHKNRIRRNLEVFKPTTIHRALQGQRGEFFNSIMEFPDPQPRGIRKDVKVFDWSGLAGMLDKVIGKLPMRQMASTPESTPPMSPASQCSSLGYVNVDAGAFVEAMKRSSSIDSTPLHSPAGMLQNLSLSDFSPIIGTPELQYPPSPAGSEERRMYEDLGLIMPDYRTPSPFQPSPDYMSDYLESPGGSSPSIGDEESAGLAEMEKFVFLDFPMNEFGH